MRGSCQLSSQLILSDTNGRLSISSEYQPIICCVFKASSGLHFVFDIECSFISSIWFVYVVLLSIVINVNYQNIRWVRPEDCSSHGKKVLDQSYFWPHLVLQFSRNDFALTLRMQIIVARHIARHSLFRIDFPYPTCNRPGQDIPLLSHICKNEILFFRHKMIKHRANVLSHDIKKICVGSYFCIKTILCTRLNGTHALHTLVSLIR